MQLFFRLGNNIVKNPERKFTRVTRSSTDIVESETKDSSGSFDMDTKESEENKGKSRSTSRTLRIVKKQVGGKKLVKKVVVKLSTLSSK